MTSQRYEPVAAHDSPPATPSSPPPSFKSRASSRRSSSQTVRAEQDAERSLADAFETPSDDDDDDADDDQHDNRPLVTRTVPVPTTNSTTGGRAYGGGIGTRDGVFANMNAKPTDEVEEKPPTYEQSQQDPTPPYWETTILTPGGFNSDDVFIDGLLVGSLFSFVWNALISMSFQLIGFLLTYLLHTTHAAKHGSRAGLGITLIQYGFTMYNSPGAGTGTGPDADSPDDLTGPGVPSDPNAHDFDPNAVPTRRDDSIVSGGMPGLSNWFSYVLIISGWMLLIKGTSDFVRARRQEQLIRASPERGLAVPVVATGEGENAV